MQEERENSEQQFFCSPYPERFKVVATSLSETFLAILPCSCLFIKSETKKQSLGGFGKDECKASFYVLDGFSLRKL